jgi:hypothetical protein
MRADLRALAALGLALSAPALGYQTLGFDWSWQSGPISEPFFVNPTSFPGTAGTTADVRTALQEGMARWGDDGGADFAFLDGGDTTSTSWTYGDAHVAQFSNTTIAGATLAIAQSWEYPSGCMLACDIRFYQANGYGTIAWSSNPSGAAWNEMDLEQVATHEFGHCAGLDHSSHGSAIMYASVTSGGGPANRELHFDDQDGVQAIYGVPVGYDMQMDVLDPVTPGATIRVSVTGAGPRERVWLAASTVGTGDGNCYPQLGGRCASILPPVSPLGSVRADMQGNASYTWTVPSNWAGLTLGLQAVSIQGNAGSSTLMSNAFEAQL